MKLLLAVLLLVSTTLEAKQRVVRTSAWLGSMELKDFLRGWHPNGFPANNDFTYSVATDEGKLIELTCSDIRIPSPCNEAEFNIIDGEEKTAYCGEHDDLVYKSKSHIVSVQLLSADADIQPTPKCSAKLIEN